MGVVSIQSTVSCDGCGTHFKVDHDPAYKPPAGWSLFDVAEDAVRGGYVLGSSLFDGSCSVQNGSMLCIPCTRAADRAAAPGGASGMRILEKKRGYFRGTHKGCTIEIERDRTSGDDQCKFYITVQGADGCYRYDGWSPEGVETMAQAKREAIRGACL